MLHSTLLLFVIAQGALQVIGGDLQHSPRSYTVEKEEYKVSSIQSVRTVEKSVEKLGDDYHASGVDQERLIGGTDAASGQYPFVVLVISLNEKAEETTRCGGALISSIFVLTSARCIVDAIAVKVQAKTLNGSESNPVFTHGTKIIHPNFYRNTMENDIALVQLAVPFDINSGMISTIRLPESSFMPSLTEKTVHIYGFGTSSPETTEVKLRRASMVVQSSFKCSANLKPAYYNPMSSHTCLDTEGGVVGMCTNDNGGPVTYKFPSESETVIVGVLSDYIGCNSIYPNVFTRISPFLSWIRNYVSTSVNSG